MSHLGIDIGSSQVKAVAFDAAGAQLASAYAKYQFETPRPGWMELDGNAVLEGCFQVIAQCAAQVSGSDPVEALAISSQGEAFSPVDKDGRILAPAMISGDSRSTQVMAEFTASFGKERLYRITGHTPSAMFSLAKLLYISREHPEIWSRAVKFLCFEELLINALGGEAVTGWPLAARTMLFDVRNHCWSKEILDAIGLSAQNFARPNPAGEVAGTILPEVASRLGLSGKVKLVSGGHDQIIGAYGCGATVPGSAMYAAGSVECIVPVFDKLTLTPELFQNNLCTYDFAEPGKFASVAYSLTGSNLLEYFMKTFAIDRKCDYPALLAEMPQEPTDILTLPYFTPSGTPYFDEKTPGCVFGWRIGDSRGALLKALEEGIALEMKLNFELLRNSGVVIDNFIGTGGGFRDMSMVQLRADVLDSPIAIIDVKEAGCRGAASLAKRALTGEAFGQLPIKATVKPDASRAAIYAEKFLRYKEFSSLMRGYAGAVTAK